MTYVRVRDNNLHLESVHTVTRVSKTNEIVLPPPSSLALRVNARVGSAFHFDFSTRADASRLVLSKSMHRCIDFLVNALKQRL